MGSPSGAWRDKALLAFTLLAVALSTLGFYIFQSSDPCRCKSLLEDGFWLDPAAVRNWQPAGCMLHTYRPAEAQKCFAERRVVFVGGDQTLEVFNGLAAKVEPDFKSTATGRSNHIITVAGVSFEFIWDPALQSSELREISIGYELSAARPALTVVGLERELVRDNAQVAQAAAHVGAILSQFSGPPQQQKRRSDALVVLPILTSRDPENTHFWALNDVLTEVAAQYDVEFATAFNKVLALPEARTSDMRVAGKPLAVLADILLNRRCNAELPKHYPFASTCCNTYPRPSWVQLLGFIFIAILIPGAAMLYRAGYTPQSSAILSMMPEGRFLWPIFTMGATVVLCYYCDRSNIFGKEQKQTSPSQFFVVMGLIILGSFITMKTEDKDQAFLNRDQTDEWKGWMQVAILVYHYVGVSKTEYIYNYMRVMPTAYLFMTGFGHTVYFLKKDDFSFKRYVATMLRLNLLNVILAYAMGNDWLLYYFAPLVTWNFHVAFFLLWAGHKYNKNKLFLFGKMVVAALVNTAFYRVPGVLEAAWKVCQVALHMQGDMREWRFRITLDQYSMFPGMVAAVLFLNWSSYSLPKSSKWPWLVSALTAASAGIMIWYAFFETSQPSKQVYNQKHTYVSWLPCCAFVILRNATPWLRRTHNGFFAWVGRGSLETFLLQFHIWLAADTAGLLMFGPPHLRLLNVIITTPIFFWVASHVTAATGGVIEWIMAAEPKQPRTLPVTSSNTSEAKPAAAATTTAAAAAAEMNGSAPQDTEKQGLAVEPASTGARVMKAVSKDLRVRVGMILVAMAVMNWTYYI